MNITKPMTDGAERQRLLIVDDDRNWAEALRLFFHDKYDVEVVNSAVGAGGWGTGDVAECAARFCVSMAIAASTTNVTIRINLRFMFYSSSTAYSVNSSFYQLWDFRRDRS